jgi:ABC-2 type transport system permease protein
MTATTAPTVTTASPTVRHTSDESAVDIIPTRSEALARSFRSEWTKLRTLRSTWITIATSVAISIGFALINVSATSGQWADMSVKQRADFDPTSSALIGVLFAALIFGALAIRSMTSEYTTGMIRVTFSATADRRRVFAAKASIIAVIAFVVALVSNFLAYFPSQQILRSKHIESSITDPGVLTAIVLGAFAVSAVALVGFGLGSIIKRTALATTMLSVVIIGGQLVGLVLPEGARKYLPSSALQATVSVHRLPELLTPGSATTALVIYAVLTYAVAKQIVARRDV